MLEEIVDTNSNSKTHGSGSKTGQIVELETFESS